MKKLLNLTITISMVVYFSFIIAGCSGGEKVDPNNPMTNKGIGPVKSLELGAIDQSMADEGKKIFDEKCTACHKIDTKYIGPALKGVTTRRTPEWIMNMILNPELMLKNDPIAKSLIKEYAAPMANQGLKEDEARKILEYFRTNSK